MTIIFFNRKITVECHQKMKEFSADGDDIVWVAFPPGGGNHWSIVAKSGAYFQQGMGKNSFTKVNTDNLRTSLSALSF